MIGRRLFNIASVVSFVLLTAAIRALLLHRELNLNWVTHGTMDVKHTLTCADGIIGLENEDQLNPAQFAAALNRLNAAEHFNYTAREVIIDGLGTHHTDLGVLEFESGYLSIDLNSVSSRLPSGIVCGAWSRVEVPVWFPLGLFSIMPLLWVCRWMMSLSHRSQARARGNGSDNAAVSMSGVCRERGTAEAAGFIMRAQDATGRILLRRERSDYGGWRSWPAFCCVAGVGACVLALLPADRASAYLAPFVFWAILFAHVVIILLSRRRKIFREGSCPGCGYDLTGNVSGRCPECGIAITKT